MPTTLLEDIRNWFWPLDSGEDVTLAPLVENQMAAASPLAFVVDDEDGICKLITMTLAKMGVEAEKCHTAQEAIAALDRRLPAIIFLDVALQRSDAVDVIRRVGGQGDGGTEAMIGSD